MSSLTTAELQTKVFGDKSLRGLLERQVAGFGDKPLIRWHDREYSYRELDELANAAANSFLALGIGPGDRVGIMMTNTPQWLAYWLGAAKIGAVTVTINTAHKGDGLEYQLRDSSPSVLAVDAEFAPRIAALANAGEPTIFVGDGLEADTLENARPFAELFTSSTAAPPVVELRPSTPCSILYTSGTTGPAKGCLLPHGQYLAAAHLHSSNCGYGPDTTVYACLPLFHIAAQNYAFLSVLAAGATLALDNRFTASGFWNRVVDSGATAFNFVGSMPVALWNQEAKPIDGTHGARLAFGAPVPVPIWGDWEERFNVKVVYAYGMTENALPAIVPADEAPVPPHRRGATGRESPTSEVGIVDENDAPVPPGMLGEIVTRPKIPWTMMLEYVGRPAETADTFRNCWFHTGDIGYFDDDGYLFYVDRKRDALRRRGEMVSSWEVEASVSKFPGVAECAVVGVPSDLGEDDILVVVVTRGDAFDPAELIAFCEDRMAKFQVPRYVRVVADLPRTQTQRVEKYRLREEGLTADTWDAQEGVNVNVDGDAKPY